MALRILALVVVTASSSVRTADAHSVVIIPRPRNAVDGWDGSAAHPFPKPDNTPGCTESMGVCGCWCTNGTEPCAVGQTCFWFSQGCTVGAASLCSLFCLTARLFGRRSAAPPAQA